MKNSTTARRLAASAALVLGFGLAASAQAGVVVYDKDGKKIEVGGRIQMQYLRTDPSVGETQDDAFFRRLRPYILATLTEHWAGKIEADFGKAIDGDEVAVKDAFMQYTGGKLGTLMIGNSKTPFSRDFLASSKRQTLVERTYTGDHNFGAPDRMLGFRLDGGNSSRKLTWSLATGMESHDPGVARMDFDSPVADQTDWNEGRVVAGRLDFHPLGEMKFDQGDFHSKGFKITLGVSAFSWENDGDRNTYTSAAGTALSSSRADLDTAEGIEASFGLRGEGLSVDAFYQEISGDTVVNGFTGGLYRNGTTDLDKFAVKGGYMLPGDAFEVTAGWDSLDATNYVKAWEATSIGANYYWSKHDVKVQLTHRMEENVDGFSGKDIDSTFLQFQFVF